MSVSGNTVSFFTSTDTSGTAADNSINISGKADKVTNATNGNIAGLDANGNLTDSGVAIASDADVTAMITDVFGAAS